MRLGAGFAHMNGEHVQAFDSVPVFEHGEDLDVVAVAEDELSGRGVGGWVIGRLVGPVDVCGAGERVAFDALVGHGPPYRCGCLRPERGSALAGHLPAARLRRGATSTGDWAHSRERPGPGIVGRQIRFGAPIPAAWLPRGCAVSERSRRRSDSRCDETGDAGHQQGSVVCSIGATAGRDNYLGRSVLCRCSTVAGAIPYFSARSVTVLRLVHCGPCSAAAAAVALRIADR